MGIDRRTVAVSVRAGVLSGRAREALERALVKGDGASCSWGREDVEALEQRRGEFEAEMRGTVESVRGEAVKKGRARTVRMVERLIGHVGVTRNGGSDALAPADAGDVAR